MAVKRTLDLIGKNELFVNSENGDREPLEEGTELTIEYVEE